MLQFILFADDTTILFSDKDISNKADLINMELKEVTNWFKTNKLSVNASKTNFMIMGTTHQTSKPENSIKVILDNVELSRVNKTKFLGVLIDENLTWKDHIDAISKTMSRNVGMINKLKHFVPKRILLSLYYTLVMPYLNYGILAWGNLCKTYLNKLLKLQKRAVRHICKTSFRHSSIPLLTCRDLHILNVYNMYNLELGVFMYKYSTDDLPTIFNGYFSNRSQIYNRDTRNKANYNLRKNRTNFASKGVKTAGPGFWNSLPKEIKLSLNVKAFRKQLKDNIFSSQ